MRKSIILFSLFTTILFLLVACQGSIYSKTAGMAFYPEASASSEACYCTAIYPIRARLDARELLWRMRENALLMKNCARMDAAIQSRIVFLPQTLNTSSLTDAFLILALSVFGAREPVFSFPEEELLFKLDSAWSQVMSGRTAWML
ncbi:hypothetical protein J4211_05880 [Candidatus Woesearchaeota archaeon]|nr:hypothetical protein [Candidatus Woesearchaeota archaeon]